jgi:hypothetical protein
MKSVSSYLQLLISTHPQAATVLAAFILLALIYSVATPPLEAGDESRHYAVVKYMADTGRLPVQEPGDLQVHASHEANQPPLYYGLAAGLTGWIETGSWDDVFWYNPHTTIGTPLRLDNKNITIHPPGSGWPWRGHVLAVHLIRFLSIAMATVTVTAAYAIAFRLFKGNQWLAAGALAVTAFNPMFIFISASVNNDNAVIMFVTLALLIMGQGASSRGAGEQGSIGREADSWHSSPLQTAVVLGVLIGLGALSKLYALGLLPLAGLMFLWLAYERGVKSPNPQLTSHISHLTSHISHLTSKIWRNALLWTLMTVVVVLLVAGWFYIRNAMLYDGDILALQTMRDTAGQRNEVPSLATVQAEFKGFRIAYWALFGGVNILADEWIYTVLDWVSLAAALGVVGFVVVSVMCRVSSVKCQVAGIKSQAAGDRSPNPQSPTHISDPPSHISYPTFALLLTWTLIMVAGLIVWNSTQPAGQGRLLYPAIAAISALGVLGLTWWLPMRAQHLVVGLVGVGLFAFALATPFLYITPVYARPPLLTQAELPGDVQPVDFSYDGKVRLIGYTLPTKTIRPTETLPLTLYWEILAPTGLDYSVFIHLLGRKRRVVGQIDSYPGNGAWPATLLNPGDIVADHYQAPTPAQAEWEHAPTRLLIAAGIYDYNEPGRPGKPVLNAAGEPVEPIIATAKLVPWQWPAPPPVQKPVNFFDKVTLLDHRIAADQQVLTLTWQVQQPLDTDYTVFIQAWDSTTGAYMAGFDGQPIQGDYPTSLWASGEVIIDTHPLDPTGLSPGEYRLLAGLYNPITEERLPAFGPAGPLPDYAVDVGTLRISH